MLTAKKLQEDTAENKNHPEINSVNLTCIIKYEKEDRVLNGIIVSYKLIFLKE